MRLDDAAVRQLSTSAGIAVIYVVDDDRSVRKALARLIKSASLPVETFSSGNEFLESARPVETDCLLIDVHMPGMTGLELQQRLVRIGMSIPVIFISAFDDENTRAQARQQGAIAFFRKPIDDIALLDAIYSAAGRQHG